MTLTHRIDNTHGVMFTTQVPVDVLRRSLGTGSLMLLTLILLTLSAKIRSRNIALQRDEETGNATATQHFLQDFPDCLLLLLSISVFLLFSFFLFLHFFSCRFRAVD